VKENLEKAKEISKILEKTNLPPEAKTVGVLGAALGAEPEKIVRAMAEVTSAIETQKAEVLNPKPEPPKDYTETERIIAEMLWENTGVHILDSGGAYGRHWQENRQIKDFRELPEVEVEVWKDGEVLAHVNVFHYLTTFLERTKECEELEKMLYEFAEREENRDLSWLGVMEEFGEKVLEPLGYHVYPTTNTYNYENLLSQGLQYIIFESEDGESYIMLQIHNGCDVRGGYTAPRIFKVVDVDYFHIAQSDLRAYCECTSVWTDDAGYHWYGEEGKEGFPEHWKPVPKKSNAKDWEYKLVCEKCGKDVQFEASLYY